MFTTIFQGDFIEGGLTSVGNQKRARESPWEHTEQSGKTNHLYKLSCFPSDNDLINPSKSQQEKKPYVNFFPEKFLPVIKSTEVLQEKKTIIIIVIEPKVASLLRSYFTAREEKTAKKKDMWPSRSFLRREQLRMWILFNVPGIVWVILSEAVLHTCPALACLSRQQRWSFACRQVHLKQQTLQVVTRSMIFTTQDVN